MVEESLISSHYLPPSRIILDEGIWQVHPTHVVILILDCIRNRNVERCKHWQSGERGLILKSRSYYGVPFFFWFSSSSLTSDRWRDQKNGLKSVPGHAVLWKCEVATLFSTCLPLYGHGLSQKRLLWPKIWKSPQLRGKQEWWPCHSCINPGPCWIVFCLNFGFGGSTSSSSGLIHLSCSSPPSCPEVAHFRHLLAGNGGDSTGVG